jgi:hypothetical protein
MPRDRQIKVWVDAIAAARLALRAGEAGTTVSEYVGGLISRDGVSGPAGAPASQQIELQLLTAILLKALLARVVGEEDARKLVELAKESAAEQAKALLAQPLSLGN